MSSPRSIQLLSVIEKGREADRELRSYVETIVNLPRREQVVQATGLTMQQIVDFETRGCCPRVLVLDQGQLVCCVAGDNCSLRLMTPGDVRDAIAAREFGGYHPCA